MSMGMGMYMTMSPKLSMRQEMVCRLKQTMRIEQKMIMALRLYQVREDECKRMYGKALKRGDVRQYEAHGLKFEYARVYRKEVPTHIIDECGCGFAHCLYSGWDALLGGTKYAMARGSWLLFVVSDYFKPVEFPLEFLSYVAVHEHGEEVTLGEHHLATKLEFAVSKLERKLGKYVDWLEGTSPVKFTDVFSHQTRIVLPDSPEFQRMLEAASQSDYATRVRRMIERFEWPAATLQKLRQHEKHSSLLQQSLIGALSRITTFVSDQGGSAPAANVMEQVRAQLTEVVRAGKEQANYICLPNFQLIYQDLRNNLDNEYAQYRRRRYELLDVQPDGIRTYTAEIQEVGETLPTKDVFSRNFREAMNAL